MCKFKTSSRHNIFTRNYPCSHWQPDFILRFLCLAIFMLFLENMFKLSSLICAMGSESILHVLTPAVCPRYIEPGHRSSISVQLSSTPPLHIWSFAFLQAYIGIMEIYQWEITSEEPGCSTGHTDRNFTRTQTVQQSSPCRSMNRPRFSMQGGTT